MIQNALFQHIDIARQPQLRPGGHRHIAGILTLFAGGTVNENLLRSAPDSVFAEIEDLLQNLIGAFDGTSLIIERTMAYDGHNLINLDVGA